MNPHIRRSRTDRRPRVPRRALLTGFAVGGLLLTAALAGAPAATAAPTASLVYSTDGGTTWTTTPTLSSGQNVLVRQYYNNDTAGSTTGASVTATVPTGFTRVPNTTQVCLNPGTTDPTHPTAEQVCNTSTGQGGAINESAVWSGANLTISPTAGVYGQPTNATSGTLAMGKKAYLNLANCAYYDGFTLFLTSVNDLGNPPFQAGTTASNTPASSPGCAPGDGVSNPTPGDSGMQNIGLLGNRYLNLANCAYYGGGTMFITSVNDLGNPPFSAGTNASNTAASSPGCASGDAAFPPVPGDSGMQNLDLLGNRYVNLANCAYYGGGTMFITSVNDLGNPPFQAGTDASNTLASDPGCAGGSGAFGPAPGDSGMQNIDTLDQNRGQGYVQFQMIAPVVTTTTTVPQTGGLTGPGTGDPTTTANVTVTAAIGTPLLTSGPTGIAAIAGLGALFAMVIAWRRRAHR